MSICANNQAYCLVDISKILPKKECKKQVLVFHRIVVTVKNKIK